MPRSARTVFAGVPHHVTQRGNRREDVFFTDDDREAYLEWLKAYCDAHAVAILAYCLMTNHVHLVAVPASDDGLQRALKPLHMRYAQRVNRKQKKGDASLFCRLAAVADWSAWLAEGDEAEELAMLRRNVDKGLPCGSEAFIDGLEALADRPLRFRPIGRPRKSEDREADE